jgi:hypothetical protein
MRRRTVEGGAEQFDWLRLNCKSYGCGTCGPRKAARLRKTIVAKAQELDLTRLLTLTLDPANIPLDVDSVKYLRGVVWAKFRTYLKRKYGKIVVYIAVLEFTKAGVPHLHVLVGRFIPQQWISESWDALGGGRIVDIRRVYDIHRMGRYLAKYLTKDVILSAPPWVRRWTTSRGIKLFEKQVSSGKWEFLDRTFDILHMFAWRYLIAEEEGRDGRIQFFTTNFDLNAI